MYKSMARRAAQMVSLIVLQRDKDSEGTITLGPDGFSPKVDYVVAPKDRKSMISGLRTAVRILAAEKPAMIGTMHSVDTLIELPDTDEEDAEDRLNT